VSGGNIEGGNPVEVPLMKVASLLSSGREDQKGGSGPTLETPWSRRERAPCLEGHVRMACSNVSGSRPRGGRRCRHRGTSMLGGPPGSFSQHSSGGFFVL